MRCANCDSENPEGTKFCGECGAPLPRRCTGYGAENPPRFKFCKDNLHTDYVPVGHSTNLASRMESLAMPGSIVVSEHTHRPCP